MNKLSRQTDRQLDSHTDRLIDRQTDSRTQKSIMFSFLPFSSLSSRSTFFLFHPCICISPTEYLGRKVKHILTQTLRNAIIFFRVAESLFCGDVQSAGRPAGRGGAGQGYRGRDEGKNTSTSEAQFVRHQTD